MGAVTSIVWCDLKPQRGPERFHVAGVDGGSGGGSNAQENEVMELLVHMPVSLIAFFVATLRLSPPGTILTAVMATAVVQWLPPPPLVLV